MNDRVEEAIEQHILEQLQLNLDEAEMNQLEQKVLLIRKLAKS